MEAQPAFGELRPARAQAAAVQRGEVESRESARPAGRFEQLQRELAGEVGERELRPPAGCARPDRGSRAQEGRRRAARGPAARGPQAAAAARRGRDYGAIARRAGEHRAQRVARAGRGLALEHRVSGVGHHEQVRVGDLRGERAGVGGGGAQVVGAAEDQRGDVGHRFRHGRGRRGGKGPEGAGARTRRSPSMFAGSERARSCSRAALDVGGRLGEAFGGAGGAAPREDASSSQVVVKNSGRSMPSLSSLRHRRSGGSREQAHERRGVAVGGDGARPRRGIRRAGSGRSRPRAGCRAGALEETWTVTAWPWPPIQRPLSVPPRMQLHDPREVARRGSGVIREQRRYAQSWRRMRGTAANVLAVQRVGPGGGHDGVEDQRFDVLGVLLGVLLGDLGAVGGAPQHELFVAPRAAYRLDVGDGVGGGVEGAFGADLVRRRRSISARRSGRSRAASKPWQERGCELPVPRWSKTIRSRVSRIGPSTSVKASSERDRRLPGPAGERDRPPSSLLPTGARRRRTASVIVPGVAPEGSSGTVRCRRRSWCCRGTGRTGSGPAPAGAGSAHASARGRRQERDGELPERTFAPVGI